MSYRVSHYLSNIYGVYIVATINMTRSVICTLDRGRHCYLALKKVPSLGLLYLSICLLSQEAGTDRTLVFVETKRNADFIATYLSEQVSVPQSKSSVHAPYIGDTDIFA